MKPHNKARAAYVLLALLMLLLYAANGLMRLDYAAQDRLYQRLNLVSPDIYVIGIDEETLTALGPFQSWGRDVTASLIETLSADPKNAPAVIGVDIGFYGSRTQAEDDRLVRAVQHAGNVVLADYVSFGSVVTEHRDGSFSVGTQAKSLETPFPALRNAALSDGHTNVFPDEDGVIRRSMQSIAYADETVGSFAYEVYRAYTGDEIQPPLDRDGQWYVPYSGLPMDYFGAAGEGSSFIRVLRGEFPTELFAGSIVLIGPYSAGLLDSYYTPVSRDTQMYGVEIHANVVQALLEGNFKRDLPKSAGLALLLALMLAAYAVSCRLDFRVAAACAAALSALYLALCLFAYGRGLILPIIYPLLGVWLTYFFRSFYNYWLERQERRRLVDIFSRYLSPQIAGDIARKGEAALALGGQKKDIAVLFVDIRGFTSLSERMEPERVVEFLNRYLALTTRCIFDNLGTVDKFIGDATMAIWGAPAEVDDYVYRAVKTGLDMAAGAAALDRALPADSRGQVGFGIGIHCGDAVVGNIGTDFRMEYTAIGDTVNTAARLEAGAQSGEVLVSEEVCRRLAGRIETTFLGMRQFKGKAAPFAVYRVDGLRPSEKEQGGNTDMNHGLKRVFACGLATALTLTGAAAFTDVDASYWGYDAITTLAEQGAFSDFAPQHGAFLPRSAIRRGEFVTALVKTLADGRQDALTMTDADDVPAALRPYLGGAQALGIFQGSLQPDGKVYALADSPVTRQDAAVLLGRLLEVSSDASLSYTDAGSAAPYAKPYIAALTQRGLLEGLPDGTFAPRSPITRAESAALLARAAANSAVQAGAVTTVTQPGALAYRDGAAAQALFSEPGGLAADASGALYIMDTGNSLVRTLSSGTVSTAAGAIAGRDAHGYAIGLYKDGGASGARFNKPTFCTVVGGKLLISDTGNHVIRALQNGTVYTFCGTGRAGYQDGKADDCAFHTPGGIAAGADGSLYVADTMNHCIRKIAPDRSVTTLAGTPEQAGYADGEAGAARFCEPAGIAVGADGVVYVADAGNQRIRKIENGKVTTLAGGGSTAADADGYLPGGYRNGSAKTAQFHFPQGLCMMDAGVLLVADAGNHAVRAVTTDGAVTTLAGTGEAGCVDGAALTAQFNLPTDLCAVGNTLYIADSLNGCIRKAALTLPNKEDKS